ncbi:MAG: SDR family oxidoreductase [Polyangiaceae bacterium]
MEIRTALVTGGSRGLGEAIASGLVRHGVDVVIVARDESALATAKATIASGPGTGRVHALAYDLGDKDAIHRIVGATAALVGDLDLVVHAASDLGPTPLRPLLDTDCEDLERVFAVNVVGPFRLAKVILGNMVLRGRGTFVAVSSDAAVEAYPTWGPYGASKAAFDHLLRTWSAEVASSGVRFLSVDPGEMDTAMHAAAMPDVDPRTLVPPSWVAERVLRLLGVHGPDVGGAAVPWASGDRVVVARGEGAS